MLGVLAYQLYDLRKENAEIFRLSGLSQEIEKEEILAESIEELQEEAGEEITAFEILTASQETLVPTIESIESAGRSLGLETEITSVKRSETPGVSVQTIEIVVESLGSWRGNFSLLKILESLPHRVNIESAQLSKIETGWRSRVALSLQSFD
jgi:hypothetical protein